jgi:hypothetical protein
VRLHLRMQCGREDVNCMSYDSSAAFETGKKMIGRGGRFLQKCFAKQKHPQGSQLNQRRWKLDKSRGFSSH